MKIRVFTAFSGYDSQCMALDRLHEQFPDFEYELVGWAEIDKYAIQAHNAVYPSGQTATLATSPRLIGMRCPTSICLPTHHLAKTSRLPASRQVVSRAAAHAHRSFGSAVEPSSPSDPNTSCLRMWLRSCRRSFSPCSTNGKRSSPPTDTTTSRRCSMPRIMAYPKIVSVYSSFLSSMRMPHTASPRRCHSPSDSKMSSNKMWMRSII